MINKDKSIEKIVKDDICQSCGACIGSCPQNAISKNTDNVPTVNNNCINCGICKKACSGEKFDFLKFYIGFHGKNPEISSYLGDYKESFLSYAKDSKVRKLGTSGGFIKAFLISLLKLKKIDGVILVSGDENEVWKASGIIAKTKDEILNSGKSRYSASCMLSILKKLEDEEGKFVVVALPCQIHSLWKIRNINKKLNDKILFTIGLFCHSELQVTSDRLALKAFNLENKDIKEYVSRFGKHPGTPYVTLNDGSFLPLYFPSKKFYRPTSHEILNIMYYLFTPKRCMFCFDGASELADISVGDPWIKNYNKVDLKDGYSFVVVRSNEGQKYVNFALKSGDITRKELSKEDILLCNKKMLLAKKRRAFYFIKKERKVNFGEFEKLIPKLSIKDKCIQKFSNILHFFCFHPRGRNIIVRMLFSNIGYVFLYINYLRRKILKK